MTKRGRRKKAFKPADDSQRIKIRLDKKTVITIRDLSLFTLWKEKYPNAEIII
ncbi:MAG: hypothetical protein ABIJ16_12245 [Bacteroidota bacterium]